MQKNHMKITWHAMGAAEPTFACYSLWFELAVEFFSATEGRSPHKGVMNSL